MSQIKIKQIEGLQDVLDAIVTAITSGSLKSSFTQVGHGFSAGQVVAYDGATWILADASTEDSLGRIVIESISSPDTFIGVQVGKVTVPTWNLIPGAFYVVDDSGTGVPVEFTVNDAYAYSNPIMQAITETSAHVLPWRPSVGGAPVDTGVEVYQRDLSPADTNGDASPTGITITYTPFLDSAVDIIVNGVGVSEGNGVKTSDCYFSNDGGATAKLNANIEAGDELYWNGNIAGYDLTNTDNIDIIYSKSALD